MRTLFLIIMTVLIGCNSNTTTNLTDDNTDTPVAKSLVVTPHYYILNNSGDLTVLENDGSNNYSEIFSDTVNGLNSFYYDGNNLFVFTLEDPDNDGIFTAYFKTYDWNNGQPSLSTNDLSVGNANNLTVEWPNIYVSQNDGTVEKVYYNGSFNVESDVTYTPSDVVLDGITFTTQDNKVNDEVVCDNVSITTSDGLLVAKCDTSFTILNSSLNVIDDVLVNADYLILIK